MLLQKENCMKNSPLMLPHEATLCSYRDSVLDVVTIGVAIIVAIAY